MPIRAMGNFLLCSILLGNVLVILIYIITIIIVILNVLVILIYIITIIIVILNVLVILIYIITTANDGPSLSSSLCW